MSLWRHDVSGQCVIAFRGTNNLLNTIVDAFVLILPSQELLGQSGAALQILKMNFADHGCREVTVTGHSLGAAYAEQIACTFGLL